MNHIHLIAVLLFCLFGSYNTAAQKIPNLSEKDKANILLSLRWENSPSRIDPLMYQFIKDNDTSYTLIEYHPNGKVQRRAGINVFYDAGPDTVMVIDPMTLEEWMEIEEPGFRASLNGTYVEFDSAGNKLREGEFRNGRHEGASKEWYSNGKQKSVETYRHGELTGKCQYWYPNGAIERIQDVPAGPYREYYQNGQLRVEGNYVFFLPEPDTIVLKEYEWHPVLPNAKLVQDGEWVYYDEKGKVIRREKYVKGVKK